jgi:uncharacterized protein (TIGR02757 family)
MIISDELKEKIRNLADKYETADFYNGDPSCVLKRYSNIEDIECAAFIAAVLAFGQRKVFLKKIDEILNNADNFGGPANWLKNGDYRHSFLPTEIDCNCKFYRFYSYADFFDLFDVMHNILNENTTLGDYFANLFTACDYKDNLSALICDTFKSCKIVPHGKNSANKRINMFLRWMVRKNSPVDLGIWDWYNPANLIIPLDVHVIQESIKLGLLPENSKGTLKTATELTGILKQIWPNDPCKGDYALFGLGVD